MKITSYSLLLAAAACGMALGQTAYTTPVGYVTQTCLSNSDTIVGIPLRQPVVAAAATSSVAVVGPSASPAVVAGKALLTVSGAIFGAYGGTHYVKFTSGSNSGKIYAIYSNDSTTVTIDLNGDTLNAPSGSTFSISKFWTLGELFNPTLSTNDPTTTGNAFVSSLSVAAGQRRTQLLLADVSTANINLSASAVYYILAPQVGPPATTAQWRKVGGTTDEGSLQIWPDVYFTIRNPATVTSNTSYTCTGEVDTNTVVTPLYTQLGGSTAKRDNPRMMTRPVDVTLNNLNLAGTTAFITSATVSAGNRRDELLVFDNTTAAFNKSASSVYYHLAAQAGPPATPAQWRKVGDTVDAGSDSITAGAGFIIRKYGTAAGETLFWSNTSTY